MARRRGSSRKIAAALIAAVVGTAFGAPAIGALPLGPTESATPGSPGNFSPAVAAEKASEQYAESSTAKNLTIPLVTVEATSEGPKVVTHEVSSAAQARAVATNAARGRDLVAVDTDNVVHPVAVPPKDPGVSSQWALNPSKTSFLSAWNTTMGGGITVAVVDTGVAAGHPDLAGKVLPGHEFLGAIDRDLSPMIDDCGHGTHVAGTIAAVPNNKIGIAGAAPHVRILPVRVLSAANSCGGWSSDVAKGIVWATNHGARVINLSLGGPGPDSALAQAVSYARSHGAVVVAAAGNNHGGCTPYKNKTIYPGATTGAIGVAAVDSNLQHACFSNTGSYVDLAAPGVGILSTVIVAGNPYNYGYATWDGTSMATPHVAAAAALLLAYRPVCTPAQVESRLEATAVRLPRYSTGETRLYGAGLVDPAKAIAAVKALTPGTC
jgi:subtilisin family serine protease